MGDSCRDRYREATGCDAQETGRWSRVEEDKLLAVVHATLKEMEVSSAMSHRPHILYNNTHAKTNVVHLLVGLNLLVIRGLLQWYLLRYSC
jgi:hypothetical protein